MTDAEMDLVNRWAGEVVEVVRKASAVGFGDGIDAMTAGALVWLIAEVRRLRAALAEGSSQVGRLMTMVAHAKAAVRLADALVADVDGGHPSAPHVLGSGEPYGVTGVWDLLDAYREAKATASPVPG